MHLDRVGELNDPDGDGDGLAADAGGQPAAVESFEGEAQGVLDVGTQTHSFGQQPRRGAVRVDQPRQLPAGIDEQCRQHP